MHYIVSQSNTHIVPYNSNQINSKQHGTPLLPNVKGICFLVLVLEGFATGSDIHCFSKASLYLLVIRGCIQKFPDWPPGARIANVTALCH
jgi:hypothetical protein